MGWGFLLALHPPSPGLLLLLFHLPPSFAPFHHLGGCPSMFCFRFCCLLRQPGWGLQADWLRFMDDRWEFAPLQLPSGSVRVLTS